MRVTPAVIPGTSSVGTMFAALHGQLAVHPWRDSLVASSDAYSLFVARSSAMGWLAEPTDHSSGGIWGMNDAGYAPNATQESSRVAWFQVSLIGPVSAGRPLPAQAFFACAGNVVTRVGTLRLEAVQALLPVQSLHGAEETSSRLAAVAALIQSNGWFADFDPHLRTQVRVTLDGGQSPAIRSAASQMLQWMRQFKQGVFSCDSFSLTDEDNDLALSPAVIDELWLGPPGHRATFRGSLVEWSLDALGWLAAFLAEASAHHGIETPLILTAGRANR